MKRFLLIVVFGVVLFPRGDVCAQGPRMHLFAKGDHFHVYGFREMDVYTLLMKMNLNYFLQEENISASAPGNLRQALARTFDALFQEVSDILNINMYAFRGEIRVYPDQAAVAAAYRDIYKEDFGDAAFYVRKRDAIHVSFNDLTLSLVGHEVAQAIIAHYFVVPPSAKIRDVLSGYVEYRLKKAGGTLP